MLNIVAESVSQDMVRYGASASASFAVYTLHALLCSARKEGAIQVASSGTWRTQSEDLQLPASQLLNLLLKLVDWRVQNPAGDFTCLTGERGIDDGRHPFEVGRQLQVSIDLGHQ